MPSPLNFYNKGDDPTDYSRDQIARMRAVVARNEQLRYLLARDLIPDGPVESTPPWVSRTPELTSGPRDEVLHGSSIRLKGANLEGVEEVAFVYPGGVVIPARIEDVTPSRITVEVPGGAVGRAEVWVRGRLGQAYSQFQVRIARPDGDDGDGHNGQSRPAGEKRSRAKAN